MKLLARLVHSSGINADRATASRGPGLPLCVLCPLPHCLALLVGCMCSTRLTRLLPLLLLRMCSYQVLAFLTRHLQDREQGVRSAATRLLFQVQQLGNDGDFAPVVAAAIAKLPAAVRDRLQVGAAVV